ncbi:DUF4230 domain-containing protein [Prevotella sp. A2931]|uniref:DUF4230 domain-containing protein n=1 Tax=Prevotella illustrans TaxID=2800387 RepID=A0ABS3M5Z2_9BACT|nr:MULTISPECIES: DUF4230 domain-containing protein [Prevotella]MBO1363530.1 DUF4230 domain-containing protein [Prevotella illustrans]PTL25999.1 DUF4230 domain-containing protein [Prevotella sp. oral taxon 820]
MKNIAYMIFLAILLMSCGDKEKTAAKSYQLDTIPMMVLQIQKTSRLYTTEYHLHKIITHNDVKSITGKIFNQSFHIDLPVGKRKIAIPLDATLKAYVDFSNFTSKNIKKAGKKIEIILPDPHIVLTSTKINHQEVKQYVAITRSNFTDEELTSFENQGRTAIIKDIPSLDMIGIAKENAAKTLIPFIKQMGYAEEDITITFRKQFNLNDIEKLIDKTTIENGK